MILKRQKAPRFRNNATIKAMAALMGWLALGMLSQVAASETGRSGHGYSWQNDVDILIDGSRLMTMPEGRRRNEDRSSDQAEGVGDEKSGPSICHQAGGTTWSTRDQKCSDSKPPERSQVWSTSPE